MLGTILAVAAAWLGHAALWQGATNRIHATGLRRKQVKLITICIWAMQIGVPAFVAYWLWKRSQASSIAWNTAWPPLLVAYGAVCLVIALWVTVEWLQRTFAPPCPRMIVQSTRFLLPYDARRSQMVHGWKAKLASHFPLNQILMCELNEKQLLFPQLPDALVGLRISHLSDLHFSGRIDQAHFENLVQAVNELRPDLIAITGDICDEAECLSWIPATLGQLRARLGVYFILGNHDLLVDHRDVRRLLADCDFVDLGGRCELIEVDGARLVLAGTEAPWFPAESLESGVVEVQHDESSFRLLLSHSPDQIKFAQRNGFDLVLAGHVHGGQIRIPVIGPIASPSMYGVRYAGGTFDVGGTLMHVSRGVSSLTPLRFSCAPEISLLELRRANVADYRKNAGSAV